MDGAARPHPTIPIFCSPNNCPALRGKITVMTFLEEKEIENEFKQERPQELWECCFQPVTAVFLVKEILEAG